MSIGKRKDPLPAYCFQVSLQGIGPRYDDATAFFRSVSGLKYEIEVTDYKEGGHHDCVRRLMGVAKWTNIVLEQGFTADISLVEWIETWIYDKQKPKPIVGYIAQLDTRLKEVRKWKFSNAWPCKWELSKFDAGKSELSIATLELAHEGLRLVPPLQ